jgi:hypothetical protein
MAKRSRKTNPLQLSPWEITCTSRRDAETKKALQLHDMHKPQNLPSLRHPIEVKWGMPTSHNHYQEPREPNTNQLRHQT